jgi:hypothetical protein
MCSDAELTLGRQIAPFTYPGIGEAELFDAVAQPAAQPIRTASTSCWRSTTSANCRAEALDDSS